MPTLAFVRLAGVAAVTLACVVAAGCSERDRPAPAPAAAPASAWRAAAASAPPVAGAASATDGATAEAGIAWRHAASDSDVDAAFAAARAEGKPVFLYWGAAWCPPCNQVKATLFNRQEFIARSRAFVPVYVDGDSPGAQKLGARFHVSGYPTMVLFNPAGQELTRLPGEVDPVRYGEVLTLGMASARPVKAILAEALAGGAGLTADDWRLLAFYSFDTDEQQVVPRDRVPATLAALAAACPPAQAETAARLRLKALAAAPPAHPPRVDAAAREQVRRLLADPAAVRAQTDLVTGAAAEIVRALAPRPGAERTRLRDAFDVALKRLEADPALSRADRLQALIAQVDLARIDLPDDGDASAPAGRRRAPRPALPAPLLADIRAQVGRADREITDGYERQAVITEAAYLLEHAGLDAESDALLEANLAKSHSPYYLMSGLAGNARKRGDKAGALRWYREAFEKSEGPATRLQWGAGYIAALVDLAPRDEARIEGATRALWREAAAQPDAFYERSGRSLERVGRKLRDWNRGGTHAAAMARLRTELGTLCAARERSDSEQTRCRGLLTASAKKPRA